MQSDMDYAEKMYSLFQRFLPGARPKIRGGGVGGGRRLQVCEIKEKHTQTQTFF